MQTNREVLTVREAAVVARVSPSTIRRLIAARKLPVGRIGRSIRIDARVLDRMLRREPRDVR
jgi:excisionase family DNA binding protein